MGSDIGRVQENWPGFFAVEGVPLAWVPRNRVRKCPPASTPLPSAELGY